MWERRTAQRYDLSVPVLVRVSTEKAELARTGKTRDISTRGIYFMIDNYLASGAELSLTMTFPAEVTGDSDVFIRRKGTVVRVDNRFGNSGQFVGIAAEFERHEIVRNKAGNA